MNSNNSSNESQEVKEAVIFLQSGKLDLAQKSLEDIIGNYPNHAEAIHLLGLVYLQKKDFLKAYELISKSIILKPDSQNFYTNRGEVAREMGRLDDSIRDHSLAISLDSDNPALYFNRALTFHQKNFYEEAISDYIKAIDLDRNNFLAYYYLGNLYAEIKKYDSAMEYYLVSLKINSGYWLAWANLGHVYEKLKRYDDAVMCYHKAVLINPNSSITYSNLGNVLEYLKKYDEAVTACEKAINLDPNFAPAYANLANVLSAKKKFKEAISLYKKSIELDPGFTQAYFNCSNAYLEINELGLAVECLDYAARIEPANADIYYNRGNIKAKNDIKQGLLDFEEVIKLNPNTEIVYGNLFLGYLRSFEWTQFERIKNIIIKRLQQKELSANPLQLMSVFNSLEYLKNAAEVYTKKYFKTQTPTKIPHQKGGKIKVGYFSEDFKKHPVSYLLLEILKSHNRKNFEIHAFSLSRSRPDEYTEAIAQAVDRFHDLGLQTDEYIIEFVRSQGLDIAIDLGVFTSMRLALFSEKIAPIQVNFLGYAGTSGTDFMDYIIADDFTIPANYEKFYTEKIVRLPCFMPRDSRIKPNLRPFKRSDFNLPEDGFIFVCTSGCGKITPEIFKIWMNILKQVPRSYLWLGESKDAGVTDKIKQHAESLGVDKERLIFFKFLDSPTDYLSRLRLADLFLDTFPYGAHTTANDALWAGLPLLTCSGETFASRVAGSFLVNLDLPELITHDLDAYENKAVELGNNPYLLNPIKNKLAQSNSTNGLFDMKSYILKLQVVFKLMHGLSVQGKAPENISVKAS